MKRLYFLPNIILFFHFFLCIKISAQPSPEKGKELESKYQAAQNDSMKVMLLCEMAWLYRKFDQGKALKYCDESFRMAKKVSYFEGLGFAKMAAGNVFNYHNRHDTAIVCYREAIPYFQKIPNNRTKNFRLAQLYYNLGEALRGNSLYTEAISTLNLSASFNKKVKNIENIPNIYISIANIYEIQEQYDESMIYADKALQETLQMKDTVNFCAIMNDLSNVYLSLHTHTKNDAYLQKAKKNFYATYQILKKGKYDPEGIILPTILTNLGDCMLRESRYDSAVYFLNESNRLASKIQYKWVEGFNYMHLGEIALDRGQLVGASVFLEKSLTYSKEYGDNFTMALYKRLINLESAKKNFEKAFYYQDLYHRDYVKILNEKKNRAINEIQIFYKTKEKEAKIIDLETENERKRKQVIGSALLAILGIFLAITIFMLYVFRKRVFEQRERLLEDEKQKALLQQQLIEIENKRIQEENKLQHDIHLLRQEQMNKEIDFKKRELIAKVMQLEHTNELLQSLKNQAINIEKNVKEPAVHIKELQKMIDSNLKVEGNFSQFISHFESIHPDFFKSLQAYSTQLLSSLDLKYCAYVRMQLSTKEIANLLHIEPKSVRMAQYRLKKKLKLGEEDDFKTFIENI